MAPVSLALSISLLPSLASLAVPRDMARNGRRPKSGSTWIGFPPLDWTGCFCPGYISLRAPALNAQSFAFAPSVQKSTFHRLFSLPC
ncbi:uncharacterized protein BKA78DRAFT_323220 [Phyllosticta capitalensis]|uniref:uncharacterized protein n=1 Tax=Phyllosticta capitalensis TaxID=121624 RepID=UPI00312D0C6F